VSRAEPTQLAPGPGIPVPSSAVPAVEGRAATTIRLRPTAAAALNSAWLYQRMHVNPRLSYPEFASEIVRLGLAAFESQTREAVQPKGVRSAGAPEPRPPAEVPGLPKYLRLERKELLIWPDQITQLSILARVLNRNRKGAGERITTNTLIRVAVALLLSRSQDLAGTTEEELHRSLGFPPAAENALTTALAVPPRSPLSG
jgi:hypothetical protein